MKIIKKIWWRIQYTWRIKQKYGSPMLGFGWYCSGQALNDLDYRIESPQDSADDEMSCWVE